MEHNKNKFFGMSLKYKIAFMTLVVAVIPLLIFGVTISMLYNHAFEERSNRHIQENLNVMADRLESVFSDGVLYSNYLTLNLNRIDNDKSLRQVDRDNMIKSTLNQAILIFDGIDSIVFISKEDVMYSTNYSLFEHKEEMMASSYRSRLDTTKIGKTVLFDLESDCMKRAEGKPVITMGKMITSIAYGETLGYLFINIDINQLEKSIQNEISYYLLFDSNGTCITGIQDEKMTNDLNIREEIYSEAETQSVIYEGDKYLIVRDSLKGYHWTLIGITNLSDYNVSATEIFRTLLLAGAVTTILLMILSMMLTGLLTKPLRQLKEGAEKIADGNMDVEFHFKTGDEIGRMGNIFNYMTGKIAELLKKVDYEARKKREYELALVQEQVKPHFLYNTLDIIIMLIEMNKTREAQRVTRKLADYYKNSLSSSEEIISLERELRIVEDYLDLQLMRYEDKFSYEILSDSNLEQVMVPKMTFQPLVENAIYHGLKYKENWGTIIIRAWEEGEDILLIVEDNGIGMEKEVLANMISLKEKPENHFGVYSVNHRLKLYYGEDYGIQVESRYGEGTKITIKIPAKMESLEE